MRRTKVKGQSKHATKKIDVYNGRICWGDFVFKMGVLEQLKFKPMDEYTKESLELHRKERQIAAQNLHQWLFAVITLCSAILGFTATKIVESHLAHTKMFGSASLIIFSVTILVGLWKLLRRSKNDFLAAWGHDKHIRGMTVSTDETRAINDKQLYKPYAALVGTFLSFCTGILLMILAVLPFHLFSCHMEADVLPTQEESQPPEKKD